MKNVLNKLPKALLPWYEENRRDLPWRNDRIPYHVWLSEIMLQQTRVEAVKGYYSRFLQALPTVEALSVCDDDKLHKLWEGLGYYSRVRNLKRAAEEIMNIHGGVFPSDHKAVLSLPGIGDYTAGAICSICFDLPTPAVDGNVLRVISRLLNDPTPIDLSVQKKKIQSLLTEVYPKEAGAFTQALMELGATLCGPNREPDCGNCPCKDFCLALKAGTAQQLPVKSPKRGRREEDRTVFILRCDEKYALYKRPEKGLLAGLWQFPDLVGCLSAEQALASVRDLGLAPKDICLQADKTHIFTHVQWNMRGFYITVSEMGGDFVWVDGASLESSYALPTAYRQFWEADFF